MSGAEEDLPSLAPVPHRHRRVSGVSLNQLPDDPICLIFRCLNKQSPNYFNHALVCKRWNRLAYLAQTSIANSSPSLTADAALLESLSRFEQLTSLTINKCILDPDNEDFLYGLGSACPRLAYLDLNNEDEPGLAYEGLDALFTGCIALRCLSLTMMTIYEDGCDLPPSFFGLSSLTEVTLNFDLAFLPDEFDKLRSLTKLTLNVLHNDHLPESIAQLTRLTELQLLRSSSAFNLYPDSFGGLKSLVKLSIRYVGITALPDTIGQLRNLREVYLEAMLFSELPSTFFELASLQVLELVECPYFESLPSAVSGLSSLKTLTIIDSTDLVSLPDSLCDLSNLRILVLKVCSGLTDLPQNVDRLSSLEHLELGQLESLTRLPDTLSKLTNLRTFSFNCNKVEIVSPSLLRHWSSLTTLEFGWPANCVTCQEDQSAFTKSICQLSNLKTLVLFGLLDLYGIPDEMGNLSQLQLLTISSCPKLMSVPESMSSLTSLKTLVVTACPKLAHAVYDTISKIPNLESGRVDGRELGNGSFGRGE